MRRCGDGGLPVGCDERCQDLGDSGTPYPTWPVLVLYQSKCSRRPKLFPTEFVGAFSGERLFDQSFSRTAWSRSRARTGDVPVVVSRIYVWRSVLRDRRLFGLASSHVDVFASLDDEHDKNSSLHHISHSRDLSVYQTTMVSLRGIVCCTHSRDLSVYQTT